ncbi:MULTISPECIES: serpin family protein [unclassified Coleofasciculus]|uniref:serpin family protein n=1 Tax=unclassified Coleofasciculus TaxID=2692782 RepID=UPI00188089D8|nr:MULTISPECIES: serpin family protein [unclassified Coleofasciculus]MBE9125100.1 serpin family protein [Coleofasciculus sp. LEGE 07081]MBE9150103.1 serpin family protein [Coleofasciculus sp. LEGE 07092]
MNWKAFSRTTGIAAAGIVLVGLLGGLMAQKINALNSQTPKSPELIAQLPNPQVNSQLVAANTRFGFNLFSEILKQESDQNVFISPTSVAIALAMMYNGASGETQQEMAKALELQGMSLQDINEGNQALKASLANADSEVELSIANSLWAKEGIPFKPEFLHSNQQFYKAKVTELDFANPDAPQVINTWVKENTNGKIPQIIDQIKSDDILFLINAIYFKGNWTDKFEENQTTERPFSLEDGTQKQHPMMSQFGKYRYYENDEFQAISLPYGEGRLSFYVFLPHETANLDTFQQQLTTENWQQWMNQFRQRNGSIVLPRFKLEYGVELNDALKALGMESAFGDGANFANLSEFPVGIDQVTHKTFVEVNEEGTEAAAVTSIGAVTTSISIPEEPFRMVVNRPFFCAIRDNQTGTLLFMGSIREPQE